MKIGIVHPNLMLKGGAEAVTIEIIQALRDQHDLELITFQNPDIKELNRFFGTDLKEEDFSPNRPLSSPFFRRMRGKFFKMRNGVIKRYAKKNSGKYDTLVCGFNEADLGQTGIQYIHVPDSVNEQIFQDTGEITEKLATRPETLQYKIYLEFVDRFLKPNKIGVSMNKTLCNSSYSKRVYEEVFNDTAEILQPPVSIEFDNKMDFEERENGFVIIGSIASHERQKETIRIIDKIRKEFDIHLHIVGKSGDPEYMNEVKKMSKKRDYVTINKDVSREKLKELIISHKYGIHNFYGEHYGLAPAELVKGGCITFVLNKGGQVDIVNNKEDLLFKNKSEAVKKIKRVLKDNKLKKELLSSLDTSQFNSPSEFREKIREKVEEIKKGREAMRRYERAEEFPKPP